MHVFLSRESWLSNTQEMWVQFLGQEDLLEEEMQPTPVFFPGKFHGQRSLVGYSPRDRKVGHDWAHIQDQNSVVGDALVICIPLHCLPSVGLPSQRGYLGWDSYRALGI